ncbi:PIN domain-containing protein [Saprospiraceae bacterium]|nr:PIN domain-containing protein [Saprospiraceae bacterium]
MDTNIIIDLLADRQPFSNAAYVLFKEAKLYRWQLFTSSNSILTTYYILEKQLSSKDANHAIETILSRIEIMDLTKKKLMLALKSKTEDLEDASQIECANKIKGINYIITRDKKGFINSIINILNPDELISLHLEI